MKLRINKLISDAGLGSRREVEDFIRRGRVKINGRRADLSDMVSEHDVVLLDDVDLPVKDLIREHVALEKQLARERAAEAKPKTKGRAAERAESQRIQHASKSAALRKTSKNNPINKRRARLEAELEEETFALDERAPRPARREPSAGRRGRTRQRDED